jgi:hypothetical protein
VGRGKDGSLSKNTRNWRSIKAIKMTIAKKNTRVNKTTKLLKYRMSNFLLSFVNRINEEEFKKESSPQISYI